MLKQKFNIDTSALAFDSDPRISKSQIQILLWQNERVINKSLKFFVSVHTQHWSDTFLLDLLSAWLKILKWVSAPLSFPSCERILTPAELFWLIFNVLTFTTELPISSYSALHVTLPSQNFYERDLSCSLFVDCLLTQNTTLLHRRLTRTPPRCSPPQRLLPPVPLLISGLLDLSVPYITR